MLKYLVIIVLLVGAVACHKTQDAVLAEKPVEKKIEFHVHGRTQYTEPYFNNVTAAVTLKIYKINYRNGESQLLWETSYEARPLAQFPHLPQKFREEKSFDVLESKEKLQAVYTIRYQSPAGPSTETRAEELVPGDKFVFLDVDI